MCSPSRSFLHIFLFTNIHNLSLYLILWLSLLCISLPLSLQPRSLSLFRHVNHPRLFISLTLSLSSATLTHFTLFCFGCNLSVFLSPSLSFFPTLTVTFQTCTLSLSLSFSCSRFSLPAAMLTSFISSLALFLSLSLSHHLSLSLSLQPCSPILLSSVVDATSLPFSHSPFLSLPLSLFSHTHTLLSSVADMASLCLSSATLTVTLQTRTLPPYLSLSLSRSPSLPPSLPPSLSFINFP